VDNCRKSERSAAKMHKEKFRAAVDKAGLVRRRRSTQRLPSSAPVKLGQKRQKIGNRYWAAARKFLVTRRPKPVMPDIPIQ
jgi:hypothetical protein